MNKRWVSIVTLGYGNSFSCFKNCFGPKKLCQDSFGSHPAVWRILLAILPKDENRIELEATKSYSPENHLGTSEMELDGSWFSSFKIGWKISGVLVGKRLDPDPFKMNWKYKCWMFNQLIVTLPKTNYRPWKWAVPKRYLIFQPLNFQWQAVSIREGTTPKSINDFTGWIFTQ